MYALYFLSLSVTTEQKLLKRMTRYDRSTGKYRQPRSYEPEQKCSFPNKKVSFIQAETVFSGKMNTPYKFYSPSFPTSTAFISNRTGRCVPAADRCAGCRVVLT